MKKKKKQKKYFQIKRYKKMETESLHMIMGIHTKVI